jgi:hypothetical protein
MPQTTTYAHYHNCVTDGQVCSYYQTCVFPTASTETLKRIATGGVCPSCWAKTRK